MRLAIDDFGTGYSCLSYLRRFRSTCSRSIARSFRTWIRASTPRRSAAPYCRSPTGLSLDAVAEGIETEKQLAFLTKHGCQYGQGHYFSVPSRPAIAALMVESGGQSTRRRRVTRRARREGRLRGTHDRHALPPDRRRSKPHCAPWTKRSQAARNESRRTGIRRLSESVEAARSAFACSRRACRTTCCFSIATCASVRQRCVSRGSGWSAENAVGLPHLRSRRASSATSRAARTTSVR